MPIWVAIGILVSIGVYQTLIGKPYDDEILNAPNLMSETIQHIYISGVSFAIVAGDRRARGCADRPGGAPGAAAGLPASPTSGRRSRASACSSSSSPSSGSASCRR